MIDLTFPILEEISAEQEMRELAEARRRYRYDVNTARSVGERTGGEKVLIQQICKNYQKGKSISEIADFADVTEEYVKEVLDVAQRVDFDLEKIYKSFEKII